MAISSKEMQIKSIIQQIPSVYCNTAGYSVFLSGSEALTISLPM